MLEDTPSTWGRRQFLKLTGISAGTVVFSQTGAVAQEDANVSVQFEDQESDGSSVVVESLYTEVEAEVIIFHSEGNRQRYSVLNVEAGTEFSNRTIELDEPIPETQLISISIQPPEGAYSYGGARATVAVDESLEATTPEIELVEADPDAGFDLPYALFKPPTDQNTERPIYIQPNNAPPVETRDELKKQITDSGFRAPRELGFPALIPGLPRLPNDGLDIVQTLAIPTLQPDTGLDDITTDAFPQETLERVDEQIVNMIDDAQARLADEPYLVANQVHMEGFSGAGTFTSRFAFLHPDLVSTISIGGTGAAPLPHETLDGTRLPYPLGTADYEELMGREFNKEAWVDIDQFFFNGQEDQPLPDTDPRSYYGISLRHEDTAVEVFGENRITERLPTTLSVYDEAGANVSSTVYEGVGHLVNGEMLDDIVAFHGEHSPAESNDSAEVSEASGGQNETVSNVSTTDTETSNESTPTQEGETSTDVPGFGVLHAITAAGGLVYLIKQRGSK